RLEPAVRRSLVRCERRTRDLHRQSDPAGVARRARHASTRGQQSGKDRSRVRSLGVRPPARRYSVLAKALGMAHRIVGQPIGRLDGGEKVSGAARYSADVTLPGLVWGKALRSPLPHAQILKIDTSKARALPGVLAVLTAADLPDILVGRRMFDMPLLARDRVRF